MKTFQMGIETTDGQVIGSLEVIDGKGFLFDSLQMFEVKPYDLITFDETVYEEIGEDGEYFDIPAGTEVEVISVESNMYGTLIHFIYDDMPIFVNLHEVEFSIEPRMLNDPSRYDKTLLDFIVVVD